MPDSPQTAMAREIGETPAAAERLLASGGAISNIADRIRRFAPRCVVFCGRGSSGHAGVYLRYLWETRLGVLTASAAPSTFTVYGTRPDMDGVLWVVISQSGASPDLVTATEAARTQGALTLAIVNDASSPLAAASELVLPIDAGPEKSVAATKTVALSMMAGALLAAQLADDNALSTALRRLPARLSAALGYRWPDWGDALIPAPAAFVAGRGYALGPAREIALKLTETLCLPGLGFSTAELRHGPRAAVTAATPVLILRQSDETAPATEELIADLRATEVDLFVVGGVVGTLPWGNDDHPACDPIAMLLPAYAAIEAAARQQGLDPDKPPHLSKVTRTL